MTAFKLKIVTPDGLVFDGDAEKLLVRTIGGDACILARHMDYVAPLGMGRAVVTCDGKPRTAACMGGMLSVSGGEVTLVPTTFEWSESIDLSRAEASYQRANKILSDKNATETDLKMAQARLHRALVRKSVGAAK